MIKIKKNTNGDTRVANKVPTMTEFCEANCDHCKDVKVTMYEIASRIRDRGISHDWTKSTEPYMSMFYRDLCDTISGKMKFEDGEWGKEHYMLERHHLNSRVPDDVNLIDVLEMIADCVCAGMARSGSVRPIEIDSDVLQKAVKNTADMIESWIEIGGD